MKIHSLDMVWPAMYVAQQVYKFWFLIVGTIFIEFFTIKLLAKLSWRKSILASVIGNCVSGIIGTFIMTFAMLLWHLAFDWILPHATFDLINWIATYILMCVGSVAIETYVVKLIFKKRFQELFPAMLIGNLLSYLFIAVIMVEH